MPQRPRLLFGRIEADTKEDKQQLRSSKVNLGLKRLEQVMAGWNTKSLSGSTWIHGLHGKQS
jgi:hypothetical protein